MKNLLALFVAIGLWPASTTATMNSFHAGALNSKAELDFVKAKINSKSSDASVSRVATTGTMPSSRWDRLSMPLKSPGIKDA